MTPNTDQLSAHSRLRRLGKNASNLALTAVLRAHELLGVATGTHLREARAQDDPLRRLRARVEEAEIKARLAWEAVVPSPRPYGPLELGFRRQVFPLR